MTNTQDPEVFQERWNSHVDQLATLWHTLPEEKRGDLNECIDEMKELVEKASEELEE